MKKRNYIEKMLIILMLVIMMTVTSKTIVYGTQTSNESSNWESIKNMILKLGESPLASEETRKALSAFAKGTADSILSSPVQSIMQGNWQEVILGPVLSNTIKETQEQKKAEEQSSNEKYSISQIQGTTSEKKVSDATHTAGEVIDEADKFIKTGEKDASKIISENELKSLSDTIYNILLVVAIVLAVLLGAVLGLKFIIEGVEGRVEVKKALLPYVLGCVVVFGSFTIWKIVVLILQGIE